MLTLCLVAYGQAEPLIRAGDRIAIVGNTFADQLRNHGYLETLLQQRTNVSIRNLGWAGDMLTARDRPTGFPSEEETLTKHKTDVIIACFGMGESFDGEAGLEGFRSDLKAFIASHASKRYNGSSEVRLILVSPIAHEDLGKLTPAVEKRNADLGAYTKAMQEVATDASLPFVSLFGMSHYLMSGRAGSSLTTNGITLNACGYWAISHVFFQQLTGERCRPWFVSLDAKGPVSAYKGVNVSKIVSEESTVSFTVTELSVPSLPPPTGSELPPHLTSQRDHLAVANLAPGDYTLTVDGQEVITASHDRWTEGVPIDATPSHRDVEALRAAINDKNRQFTYSWKALNQVHIVGERKRSPSGQSLPSEVVEFDNIAKQRETEIAKYDDRLPRKRQWRLAPAKKSQP